MPVRLLVIAEGDPETWDCWSGSTVRLVDALRRLGVTVVGADADLRGTDRLLAAGLTYSPSRPRWAARYHGGRVGFALRSNRAREAARSLPHDAVLQIGATFDAVTPGGAPTFLYCDSNARLAERYASYGELRYLHSAEISRMAVREGRLYQRAARVFTMSEYARRSFLDDFGLPPDKVVTVHGGANLTRLDFPPETRRPDAPTILFVGRLWDRKGGPALLEAFRQVRARVPQARLRIVGATPPIADEAGVELVGSVDKRAPGGEERLLEIYRDADVFCMPSRYEPFGIVFIEAMLLGLPVVATDHCAMPEIVEPGRSGWLVPDNDVAALADALTTALSDRGRLREMGRAARERAQRLFTWDHVAARMLAVVESVLLR